MRMISWNINQRPEPWRVLVEDEYLDLALLQEARRPLETPQIAVFPTADDAWGGAFRTAVVQCSRRFSVRHIPSAPLGIAGRGSVPESRPGTITAVEVSLPDGERVTVVSVYSKWENPTPEKSAWDIFADASAHRVISDVSTLIGSVSGHRLIVAGDFNLLHGYGEDGSPYWQARYETVFKRMEALGLPLVGPQSPNGCQAEPWPSELPRDSRNVPTFRPRSGIPRRQLDFVFASSVLHARLRVRAMNAANEWGPSDHCRIEICLDE